MSDLISLARLKELIHYDPETGVFTHRLARGPARAGGTAGTILVSGYIDVCLDYRHYLGHRLAWFYMTGLWPEHQIDHINAMRADNSFANLREATNQQNTYNSGVRSTNTSGYRGVSWHRQSQRWRSRIKIDGREYAIGMFDTAEAASAAYEQRAAEVHGEFTRVG